MSLKNLHILFIILSAALACLFGFWLLNNLSDRTLALGAGAVSWAACGALLAYLFWFFKKAKQL